MLASLGRVISTKAEFFFLQSTMPMVWFSASVLTWRSCGAANTGETRYVLQYAGSRGGIRLQGLRVPPGSCKLLKCLMLGLWHGRGHRFDPDQVHQITQEVRAASRGDCTSNWELMEGTGFHLLLPLSDRT